MILITSKKILFDAVTFTCPKKTEDIIMIELLSPAYVENIILKLHHVP